MNIFILDENPVIAAQAQCDKHVVKMVLESAQMLSTTHHLLDDVPNDSVFYKPVHKNHPCTIWTRESSGNYLWHFLHFTALCHEYQHRYGKIHKTDQRLRSTLSKLPANITHGPRTPFALALGDNADCLCDSAIETYRAYYQTKQQQFNMRWTKRAIPSWFQND